ncbi:SPNS [Lepeophtheirus salmonis]|uniref:SPNS n=1 Tax=Lepeophtheirus salmonis TaxID=72036 RepID=A0A7R8CIQ9_LEPSM|nr:SPNS [Lepeophtheirus salmonis]CAF2833726.1 SPNS [Lepeophtheirus salmonis]
MKVLLPFPQNPSSQELVNQGNALGDHEAEGIKSRQHSKKWRYVSILFFVNLINYMDRFTVAGILENIKDEYDIADAKAGALQTAFVITYMIFAPLFGYLGDRHSRRLIMAIGVFIWAIFTLIGSFMPGYYSFLFCRGMVGIEERSKMLAVFFFAIPVGCGSGYMLGSEMSHLTGDWRWGLRVTPILGFAAVVMILFMLKDPNRGECEGHGNEIKTTTYFQDLKDLAANKSFVLSTFGFTCVAFCTGALSWWGPLYIISAIKSFGNPEHYPMPVNNVALVFGAITMLSGIVGVPLGSILSTKLQRKFPRADPIICGLGLVISAIFFRLWNANSEAIQILISHTFGDAGSPYFIGLISDSLKGHYADSGSYCDSFHIVSVSNSTTNTHQCQETIEYFSLQHSLLSNCVVQAIGGILFFVCAIYLLRDRRNCQRIIDGECESWMSDDKEILFIQLLAPWRVNSFQL